MPPFQVKRLSPNATLPTKGSGLAAGWDLYAAEDAQIEPNRHALVKTDLAITAPDGTYGRIAPRSGLALKHCINVGAGVVDRDYQGPVGVILFNHDKSCHSLENDMMASFHVKKGDRIAQIIFTKYDDTAVLEEVDELPNVGESTRGEGGFGSTGK
jgi:dUTP pyrophosphatase